MARNYLEFLNWSFILNTVIYCFKLRKVLTSVDCSILMDPEVRLNFELDKGNMTHLLIIIFLCQLWLTSLLQLLDPHKS